MTAPPASPPKTDRYARQVRLRELGPIGQAAILAGAARVVGVGPAAEEAALYLAAAGVGRLVLEPELAARLGERLAELNPEVRLAPSALLALEVRPEHPERRADGAKAALGALLALAGLVGDGALVEPPWP